MVTAVEADHGLAVTQPVENAGFVIEMSGTRIYVIGDMAGQQVSRPSGPFSVVIVPIEGGGFGFTPSEATAFIRSPGHTSIVFPVHADDVPENARAFAAEDATRRGSRACSPSASRWSFNMAFTSLGFGLDGVLVNSRAAAFRAARRRPHPLQAAILEMP